MVRGAPDYSFPSSTVISRPAYGVCRGGAASVAVMVILIVVSGGGGGAVVAARTGLF